MPSEFNPYAAPSSISATTADLIPTGQIWRDKKDVVLPCRCVKYNAPGIGAVSNEAGRLFPELVQDGGSGLGLGEESLEVR